MLAAIEVDRTPGLEVDGRDRELQVERRDVLLERAVRLLAPAEGQHVVREVAFLADRDLQAAAHQATCRGTDPDDAACRPG